jgi:hypothetical protein
MDMDKGNIKRPREKEDKFYDYDLSYKKPEINSNKKLIQCPVPGCMGKHPITKQKVQFAARSPHNIKIHLEKVHPDYKIPANLVMEN